MVISFSNEIGWKKARWVANTLLSIVEDYYRSDDHMVYLIQEAIALDGLHFHLLNHEDQIKLRFGLLWACNQVCGKSQVFTEMQDLDETKLINFRMAASELRLMLLKQMPKS